jgi:hypothetical protein
LYCLLHSPLARRRRDRRDDFGALAVVGSARLAESPTSTTLANAFLCPLILPLNLAIEICRPRGLGNTGVWQGFPGRRQVIRSQRLSCRIAGRARGEASIPAGLLGPGREPEAHGDKEHGD